MEEEELIPIGASERCNAPRRGFPVCNTVVVRDAEGNMKRLCFSAKPMNKAVPKKRFKMECWREVQRMIQVGDRGFSLDLEKGYLQWLMTSWM